MNVQCSCSAFENINKMNVFKLNFLCNSAKPGMYPEMYSALQMVTFIRSPMNTK